MTFFRNWFKNFGKKTLTMSQFDRFFLDDFRLCFLQNKSFVWYLTANYFEQNKNTLSKQVFT